MLIINKDKYYTATTCNKQMLTTAKTKMLFFWSYLLFCAENWCDYTLVFNFMPHTLRRCSAVSMQIKAVTTRSELVKLLDSRWREVGGVTNYKSVLNRPVYKTKQHAIE